MLKQKVLFICVHNSARSQVAEAFLRQMAGDRFEVENAGLNPGKINPFEICSPLIFFPVSSKISTDKTGGE
ncbi:MAG: hypothetical protein ACOY3D_06460 [Candidatus Omnitrophota bacterium]